MPRTRAPASGLSEASFRALLGFLHENEERAAHEYEKVRLKLTRFFEWKGCIPGEDYADQTIDRVAHKVAAGLPVVPENPYLYFHGVAVNLVRERWKAPVHEILDPETPARPPDPEPEIAERSLDCLNSCLEKLPAATRELVSRYHLSATHSSIDAHRELSDSLGISSTALRLRVFRIRRQLQSCLDQCLRRRPV